jgi:hypothetical protein
MYSHAAPFTNQFISLEVHHDDEVEHFSNQNLNADVAGFHLAYEGWCDKVLPQGKISEPYATYLTMISQ